MASLSSMWTALHDNRTVYTGRAVEVPRGRLGTAHTIDAVDRSDPARHPGRVFRRSAVPDPPVAVAAIGSTVRDSEGREYLDAAGGAIVVNVGHGRASIAAVMADQAARLAYAHGSAFTTEPLEAYAAEVAGVLPVDDPAIYPNVPESSGHRLDLVTFVQNAGAVPDLPADGDFAAYDQPASRGFYARALWQAYAATFYAGGTP